MGFRIQRKRQGIDHLAFLGYIGGSAKCPGVKPHSLILYLPLIKDERHLEPDHLLNQRFPFGHLVFAGSAWLNGPKRN